MAGRVASERDPADKAEQERVRPLAIVDALEARIAASEARADAAVSRMLAADGNRRVGGASGRKAP